MVSSAVNGGIYLPDRLRADAVHPSLALVERPAAQPTESSGNGWIFSGVTLESWLYFQRSKVIACFKNTHITKTV